MDWLGIWLKICCLDNLVIFARYSVIESSLTFHKLQWNMSDASTTLPIYFPSSLSSTILYLPLPTCFTFALTFDPLISRLHHEESVSESFLLDTESGITIYMTKRYRI